VLREVSAHCEWANSPAKIAALEGTLRLKGALDAISTSDEAAAKVRSEEVKAVFRAEAPAAIEKLARKGAASLTKKALCAIAWVQFGATLKGSVKKALLVAALEKLIAERGGVGVPRVEAAIAAVAVVGSDSAAAAGRMQSGDDVEAEWEDPDSQLQEPAAASAAAAVAAQDAARRTQPRRRARPAVTNGGAPPLMRRKEFTEHNGVCDDCEKAGQLLVCEYCDVAWHPECAGYADKGDWPDKFMCEVCTAEGPEEWEFEVVPVC
jgi:hypothetical protein